MAGLRELVCEEPPDLARGDGVAVESEERGTGQIYPDARVFEAVASPEVPKSERRSEAGNGAVALAPVRLHVIRERPTERFTVGMLLGQEKIDPP